MQHITPLKPRMKSRGPARGEKRQIEFTCLHEKVFEESGVEEVCLRAVCEVRDRPRPTAYMSESRKAESFPLRTREPPTLPTWQARERARGQWGAGSRWCLWTTDFINQTVRTGM